VSDTDLIAGDIMAEIMALALLKITINMKKERT
jgi:hypothetical protein